MLTLLSNFPVNVRRGFCVRPFASPFRVLCYRHSSKTANIILSGLLIKQVNVLNGVGSNLQVGGTMPVQSAGRKFFDVPPHFSLVPPHEGGTTIVCYRLRDN